MCINELWKLYSLPEVRGHLLSQSLPVSCWCYEPSWSCKGYFCRLPLTPFSVAPNRCIKCNLGTVPGSLFKTQNVQYFLHAAGALGWHHARHSVGLIPQASLVSGSQPQLVQAVAWSLLVQQAQNPSRSCPCSLTSLFPRLPADWLPLKHQLRTGRPTAPLFPDSAWALQEASGVLELPWGSGLVDGRRSTLEKQSQENRWTSSKLSPWMLAELVRWELTPVHRAADKTSSGSAARRAFLWPLRASASMFVWQQHKWSPHPSPELTGRGGF